MAALEVESHYFSGTNKKHILLWKAFTYLLNNMFTDHLLYPRYCATGIIKTYFLPLWSLQFSWRDVKYCRNSL